jgi:uncharacterized sulfatase
LERKKIIFSFIIPISKNTSIMKNRRALLRNRRIYFIKLCTGLMLFLLTGCSTRDADRPNILWITCEDISPHLGCYGDPYAITPALDKLASEGILYRNAFSTASVCTPARSSIITGVFASSLGTQHLRGKVPLSRSIRCFTEYLREAGYYCSNNSKEDYNFQTPADAWDESSKTAHWRNKEPGQPFFSVFNFTLTHQSQTRYPKEKLDEVNQTLNPEERHDPEKVPVPPYYPNTPLVRQNIAALYTQITLMDKKVADILDQLEEDGLAGNTIVFFYSDHGDGLPRGKRWIHDSGSRVPLIIRFPEKYRRLAPGRPGSVNDELVSFIDFAPTILSLISQDVPAYMQGEIFIGSKANKNRPTVFAIRDRVDEVLEFSRSIRDSRYHYIRNFYPHRPRMQQSTYSEPTPIRQELRRMYAEGILKGDEGWLMNPVKPAEELYDTHQDPHELYNLAGDPEYLDRVSDMRKKMYEWMIETRDLSLLSESEMHRRMDGRSPYDIDPAEFPVERILQVADLVGRGPDKTDDLLKALNDRDPAVRYWAAVGLAALGGEAKPGKDQLIIALKDESPAVRFAAAEALANIGHNGEEIEILSEGLKHDDLRVRLEAAQVLFVLGEKSRPATEELKNTLKDPGEWGTFGWYMKDAAKNLLDQFEQD